FTVSKLFRFQVVGLELVPAPPFLIASNHQAWYDALFIIAALTRRGRLPMIFTMGRGDTVFNQGWKRWLLPRLGVFPILPDQGELDGPGLDTVYQILGRGGVVLIFPEGHYSRGSELLPLKRGVAHFALQAGVPISPLAISGLERLRPWGKVRVVIGPAVWPSPPRWWSLTRRVAHLIERVRGGIQNAFDWRHPHSPSRLRRFWSGVCQAISRGL
ncbi:MAG: lysophospholipid acyltransferase family protein, partial [Candidatus Dormibacteraceae bacterium]